jgi:hypothetical protein
MVQSVEKTSMRGCCWFLARLLLLLAATGSNTAQHPMEGNVTEQLNRGLATHRITGKTGSACQRDYTNFGTCTLVVWLRRKVSE